MGVDWAIQPAVRSQQHEAPTNIQSRISEGSLTGQGTHTHRGYLCLPRVEVELSGLRQPVGFTHLSAA